MANATTQTDIQQSIIQQQKSEQRKKQILNLVLLALLL